MNLRKYKTVGERRKALEKELKFFLPYIGSYSLDESIASTRNCENMIGVAQIPLGIAGPLTITTDSKKQKTKSYFIPLATTEGALVASVSRGCKAITESGGATVLVESVGATRGPVFYVKNIEEGLKLEAFLKEKFLEIKHIGEATSHHVLLKSYSIAGAGKYRFVRFVFDTGQAMGLNMVTIATEAIVRFIEKQTGIRCLSVSGNYCVDKKSSWVNAIEKRGRPVWAEVTIPSIIIETVLTTTVEKMYQTWISKCMIGSALAGSMGFNAQYANVIAAMFIATGQDPAHGVEGSMGITTTEIYQKTENRKQKTENGLYVSVCVPDLMVGTVGGGTGLPTQKEALSILGLSKENSANEFAGVIGAACLAGEISLLASLSDGSLGKAHASLGRGRVNKQIIK